MNRHNFIRWGEPASRITDIYAPQGCEAHRAFTYFFPDEYYAFLINLELPLGTGYAIDLIDADTSAVIRQDVATPVPLLQKSGKCFLFVSFLNTVSRIGHCRFVLRDKSGQIAVSNPVWFENDAKAKGFVNKVVYTDVRPVEDFDYAANQFFTELHLMISRQAMNYESELKQYRNISDRQRRNVNFDIDKTYLLDSYFFNDGDSDATAFIFKHKYILINGVRVIVKDGYALQEHKASYITKGSVTVYETPDSGTGKLPPSLSFRWVAGKEMCESYDAPDTTETIEFAEYVCQEKLKVDTCNTPPGRWFATYGNGKFVAISQASVMTSENGLDWSVIALPYAIQRFWQGIAYGNGKFVAVAYQCNYMAIYSEDAISWNSVEIPNGDYTAITFGKGKFVTLRRDSKVALYTEDAIAWQTTATLPVSGNWISLTFGNGKFVACDSNGIVVYSEDAIAWQTVTLPVSGNWRSITFGNGKFVVVGQLNVALYSEDLINWQTATLPIPLVGISPWWGLAFGGGKFVTVAHLDNKVAYSEDAINWQALFLQDYNNWCSIAYGKGKFVITEETSVLPLEFARIQFFTGIAFAESVIYRRYLDEVLKEEVTKSLLTDVEPELTEAEYKILPVSDVEARAEAVVALFELKTKPEYLSEAVIEDAACFPADKFMFADGSTVFRRTWIAGGEIASHDVPPFTDTIISTENGSPSPYTVSSKPEWLSVEISGNTATITAEDNLSLSRQGSIIYRQTETGNEIESIVGQKARERKEQMVLVGLKKQNPPLSGLAWEDYGLSYDYEVKFDGVTVRTGTVNLPVGDPSGETNSSESSEYMLKFLSYDDDYLIPKAIEIFCSNLILDYSDETATVMFSKKGALFALDTDITITGGGTGAHVVVNDPGGLTFMGGFIISSEVTIE